MENFQPTFSKKEALRARFDRDFTPEGIQKRLADLAEPVREALDLELNHVGLDFEQIMEIDFLESCNGEKVASYLGSIQLEWDVKQIIDSDTVKELVQYLNNPGT